MKLDNCGVERDLNLWSNLIAARGAKIETENCHWGGTIPNATWCPWNFYRTSGDVRANFPSIMGNRTLRAPQHVWPAARSLTPNPPPALSCNRPAAGREEPLDAGVLGVPRQ